MRSDGQKLSQFHEKRLAKALGGTPVPASGAFWSMKGDVRSEKYLLEHKATAKDSFSITKTVWKKISLEAVLSSRIPLLGIAVSDCRLMVQDENDWLEREDQLAVRESALEVMSRESKEKDVEIVRLRSLLTKAGLSYA